MAGTIVTDRIESDASYASSITVASPMVVSNTISMTNGNITGNVNFDSGLLFVDGVNNRVGVGGITNPALLIEVGNPSDSNQSLRVNFPDANTAQINSTRRSSGSLQSLRVAGQDTVQFLTNGTERMRVDIEGRVTMPYQPVFHIQKSDGNQTHATVISFNNATTNIGGHYSTSTNRFTAPIAGNYHFYCNILDDGSAGQSGIRYGLRKNGAFFQKSQNFYDLTNSTFNQTVVVATIALAASDYVDVCNDGHGKVYGNEGNFGCFGGYLIG
jgi:hypothetical protein